MAKPTTTRFETGRLGKEPTFRALFEHSADAMLILDQDTFIECNPAALRLMRAAREELLGVPPEKLSPEFQPDGQPSMEKARQMIQQAYEQGSHLFEWVHCRPDGEELTVHVSLTVVPWQGRHVLFTVWRDMTERKRLETKLHASQEQYRLLLDSQQDGVFVIQDGAVAYANGAFFKMLDYDTTELVGHGMLDFVDPEDRPLVLENYRRRLAGQPVPDEYSIHLLHKDGQTRILANLRVRVIDFQGRPAVMGTMRDMTERMRAEAERSRLVSILEMTDDLVGTADPEGRVLYLNRKARECLGFNSSLEETVFRINDAQPTWAQERLAREGFPTALAYGSWTGETAFLSAEGSEVPVLQSIMTHRGPDGTLQFYSIIARDISDRKQLEKHLQESATRRGFQVQLITEIAQDIAAAPALDDLFQRVVNQVKERLGYYHTQLLRYEPALNAVVLVKGYGEIGQRMLDAGHRMELGRGLIGVAAATGRTVLAPDVASEPNWRAQPLLPETRSEIAVPIKYGDRILGVLDVQSDQLGGLSDEDRLLLEGLCGQIAIAMEGTRLRAEMQERLNELNLLYHATSREGWRSFRASQAFTGGYLFDRLDVKAVAPEEIWVEQIEQAVQQAALVAPPPADSSTGSSAAAGSSSAAAAAAAGSDTIGNTAAVAPLSVRGEIIGALGIYDDPQRPLTPAELLLVEQVSDQVAIALESARLFEQTRAALDEAETLYDFSRQLSEAKTLEEVLHSVALATGIAGICRALLVGFTFDPAGQLLEAGIRAAWGSQRQPSAGTEDDAMLQHLLPRLRVQEPQFISMPGEEGWWVALPLWTGSQQLGAILLEAGQAPALSEEDKRPLPSITQQAAIAVESRLLFEEVLTSESRFRRTSEQLSDALQVAHMANWEYDVNSGCFLFNDTFYRFLGTNLEAEGSYSMPAAVFSQKYVHPEDISLITAAIEQAILTTNPSYTYEAPARQISADGAILHVLVRFRVVKDENGRTVRLLGANQDITERHKAQEMIAKRAVELATVAEVSTRVATIQSPDEMLQTVVNLTRLAFGLYHAHVYLYDDSTNLLTLTNGAGDIGRKMVAEGRKIRLDSEKSVVARAARLRQGVIVNDVRQDPDFLPHALLPDTHAEMAVPMTVGDSLLGVIDTQSEQVGRFSPEDVNIMTTLAAQVAVSLQNARSYARAQRQAEREALINAISERIQSTNSIENALQVAVREIGRALGARQTAIRLGQAPDGGHDETR